MIDIPFTFRQARAHAPEGSLEIFHSFIVFRRMKFLLIFLQPVEVVADIPELG